MAPRGGRCSVPAAVWPPPCGRRCLATASWLPWRGRRRVALTEWPRRQGRRDVAAAASSPRYGCRGASGVSAAGCWLLICVDWLLAAGLSLLVAVWLLLAACFRFARCFVLQLDASCLLAAASAATQVRPQGLFAQSCECSVTECFGRCVSLDFRLICVSEQISVQELSTWTTFALRHRPMTESAHTSFGVGRCCFVSCCMAFGRGWSPR